MIKYHIDNEFTQAIQSMPRFKELTLEEHKKLYSEIKNAMLQRISDKLMPSEGCTPIENIVNSLLLWVVGRTDEKPDAHQKIKSPGSYAD